jgi:hypothetical protein
MDEWDYEADDYAGSSCCRRSTIALKRGDTLLYVDQVFRNPLTGRYATSQPGRLPPPGMQPANLTGFTVWFTAKPETALPDAQAVFALDSATLGGVVLTTAAVGIFTVTGSSLATIGFPDGPVRLRYDVQIKDTSGNVFTIETGRMVVTPDVTRSTTP